MNCGCNPENGVLCAEAKRLWVRVLKASVHPNSEEDKQARREWQLHFEPKKESDHVQVR